MINLPAACQILCKDEIKWQQEVQLDHLDYVFDKEITVHFALISKVCSSLLIYLISVR